MVATPEYILEIIKTFDDATRANQRLAAREGNVVVLTPDIADDCMISADLHGHRKNFNRIKAIADLPNHPRRHLILQEVCHGGPTYPNGGDMSHAMLEDVAKLKAQYPDRVHFILTNHEWAELMEYPILKARRMLNVLFRMGMQEMYGMATPKVREGYLEFLRSCPLAVRLPSNVFICHSIPEKVDLRGFDAKIFSRELDATDLREHGPVFDLIWGRDYRPENARAFAKLVNAQTIINGHEPCPNGFAVPNDVQIIIDCCSEPASYLLVPVTEGLTHDKIAASIQMLA